jgi:hypothetical protein
MPDAHPTLRTLSQEQLNWVASLTHVGTSASTITTSIRHGDSGTDDNIIRVRDIVNARQNIRLELLAGQTPVQAILTELRNGAFAYDYDTDIEGHLS